MHEQGASVLLNAGATGTQAAEHVKQTGLTEVWAARRAKQAEQLSRLTRLGIKRVSKQRVTWVGDLQQGDGGKGAMVDRLARTHQIIVRTQGGDNAGHTTVFVDRQGNEVVVKTHLVPSGLRHPRTFGLLANGVLINAERLGEELSQLEAVSADIPARMFVSERAHLVLPLHRLADERQERGRTRSGQPIGTTLRGIGPANVGKTNRMGVRVVDLEDMAVVEERIRQSVEFFGLPKDEVATNVAWVHAHRDVLRCRAVDSIALLNTAVDAGYSVLFEGAQGPLIDIEHGIYPYVTTSPTALYSVAMGGGVEVSRITDRIGVLKAYQTMVGNGAFVSEDHGALGAALREHGEEYGTTTGRSRRCGWLDLVHARWAVELNRYTSVILTKLDVLDTFDTIGVCMQYGHHGRDVFDFRPEHSFLSECQPVYRYFPGWQVNTRKIDRYEDLPAAAREFVDYIEAYLGVDVAGVTKGPREQDMLLKPGSDLNTLYVP